MLLYFHRAFLFVLEHHPEVQQAIEEKLLHFVKNEQMRTQFHLPELEQILALSTVSRKINFDDIVPLYIEELHDRNVFLIMKLHKEFDQLTEEQVSKEYFQ